MGLLPRTAEVSGSIRFKGVQLVGRSEKELQDRRAATSRWSSTTRSGR
jgi:hypothetical protein